MSKSKYFEDFKVGEEFYTLGRTITEADLVNFSGISGVFNPLHIDEEYCKKTGFGKRIAHGPLVLSISNGLVSMLNLYEDTIIALLRIEWVFKKPVFIGDTIRVREVVEEKKETSKKDRGIIVFRRYILNQRDEEVQNGEIVILIKKLDEV
jgi:acyl dehydratase